MKKSVLVLGATGAMGVYLVPELARRGFAVDAVALDKVSPFGPDVRYTCGDAYGDAALIGERLKKGFDVIIDFSSSSTLESLLAYAGENHIPAVLCATGYSEEQNKTVRAAAEKLPLFKSANMSVGVNLLIDLCRKAAKALPSFDVEIIEKHHNQNR